MSDYKPTLCLDFDGVLHKYSRGYADGSVYDNPTDGARDFVLEAKKHFNLIIYSSRASTLAGKIDIMNFLAEHDFPIIEITNEKPPAFLTLDDRAMTFTGKWPSIETLQNFKPWNI